MCTILAGKPEWKRERGRSKHRGADIILKLLLNKLRLKKWIGFIRVSGGPTGQSVCVLSKGRGVSLSAERLSAFREGLCSVELVKSLNSYGTIYCNAVHADDGVW
jgi:hypothetical protein